jgi:hypothetical protein
MVTLLWVTSRDSITLQNLRFQVSAYPFSIRRVPLAEIVSNVSPAGKPCQDTEPRFREGRARISRFVTRRRYI